MVEPKTQRLQPYEGAVTDSPEPVTELQRLQGVSESVTERNAVQAELDYYRAALARPPIVGDDGYLPWLYERFKDELLTPGEWRQLDRAHRLIVARLAA